MAELADALDSGSNGRKAVQVQVLLPAPWWSDKKDVTPFFQYSCGFAGFWTENPENGFTVDVQTEIHR